MSMRLMAQAMAIKVGNPLRKLVLLKLADNANDDGFCFPSYKYIAGVCEISKRAAINHIDALIEMGLVSKKTRKNKEGSSSNSYQLHLEKSGELNSPPSEPYSPPSANGALPPSEFDAPITSHSFESVNEPDNPLPPKSVGKVKKQKFSAEQIQLPDWLNRDDWIAFCEHRKEIKKPLNERAAKLGIGSLQKLKDAGENITAVINQTIFNCWTGFYALKHDDGLAKQSAAEKYPELDCAQVITDFNEILSQRFEPVELNAITREKILSLAAVMKNQTNSAFRGYFAKFNEVASDFYKSGKVGFSFVMKPDTMQRVKERAL